MIHRRTPTSDKLDLNIGKIERMDSLHSMARSYFPHKNAKQLRTAFKVIWLAIRRSKEGKIFWGEVHGFLDWLRSKKGFTLDVTLSSLFKARNKMRKVGVIELRQGQWKFSTRLTRSLMILSEKTNSFQQQRTPGEEEDALTQLLYEL